MKIAFGCDHKGYILKKAVIDHIKKLGHEVVDFGCDSDISVHYPVYGEKWQAANANSAYLFAEQALVFPLPRPKSRASALSTAQTHTPRALRASTTTPILFPLAQWLSAKAWP